MGKSHVYVFNSSPATLQATGGNRFNCDFSRLDRTKKYLARFSFIAASLANGGGSVISVFMDLGSSTNSTPLALATKSVRNCNYIGGIVPQKYSGIGGKESLFCATYLDNTPIWLDSPPTQNQVLIQTKTSANGGGEVNTGPLPIYTLALYLEEQD